MLGKRGQRKQHAGAVGTLLAHAHDAAATDLDAGLAHVGERVEALLECSRRDHLAVVLGRGVDVVVVIVETGIGQNARLLRLQHAKRHAGLETEFLHAAHHGRQHTEVAILG